jgi:pimeloyl-ACP methyl ester carboxylesterase
MGLMRGDLMFPKKHCAVRRASICLVVVISAVSLSFTAIADRVVGGVPLPEETRITLPPSTAPPDHRRFVGVWVGAWEDAIRHVLIVESIRPNGEAQVIYAVGENPWANTRGAWHRHTALVSGDTLKISRTFDATYKLEAAGTLIATWERRDSRALAKLSKIDLVTLARGDQALPWRSSNVEFLMLDTELTEEGKPVRLETVVYRPRGDGPFPLLVFNHGATLNGREPKHFRETWISFTLANAFIDKGWMVAFPQRRGRGRSDGVYDEGFAPDRRQGYSCDAIRSIQGAERATADIEAAIAALQLRSDVKKGPIFLGGQSRGGLLSIAYAGKHPEQVLGVINFVGGWLAETCNTAAAINKTLFQQGAAYRRSTLWLYSKSDTTYSIERSRSNFLAFVQAGGKGEFYEVPVPHSTRGHLLVAWPEQWLPFVEQYLKELEMMATPQ